jgi:hypothetical protein
MARDETASAQIPGNWMTNESTSGGEVARNHSQLDAIWRGYEEQHCGTSMVSKEIAQDSKAAGGMAEARSITSRGASPEAESHRKPALRAHCSSPRVTF